MDYGFVTVLPVEVYWSNFLLSLFFYKCGWSILCFLYWVGTNENTSEARHVLSVGAA